MPASIATTIVTTVVSMALQQIPRLLKGGGSSGSFLDAATGGFKVEARATVDRVVRSAEANRLIVYGRAMVSGPLVFAASSGGDSSVLHMVIPLATHEIDAVEEVYFNDVALGTIDGSGNVTTGPYAGAARITKHLGVAGDPADSDLVAAGVGWTSAHKLTGVAYLVVRLTFSPNVYPTGIPNVKAVVRGKKLYDPRTGTSYWSSNPALVIRDYLTSPYGLEAAAGEIDDALVAAAANVCDEVVTITSGTEPRYTCNGVVDTGATPKAITETLLTSMVGYVTWAGGKYQVFAGAYSAPAVTITADDLRGEIRIRPRVSRRDLFNAVKGTYISPASSWQSTDYPTVSNATYAGYDGGQVIWKDMPLPFTTSATTAQRIARLQLERSRQGITVELPAKLTAFRLATFDTVMVTLPQLGWSAKEFKVVEWKFSTDGGVDLLLQEESAASYNWNISMETVVDAAPDTNLPDPWDVALPSGLTLSSGTSDLLLNGDGTVTSRIKCVWTPPTNIFTSKAQIEYKLSTDTAWQALPETTPAAGAAWIFPVQDGAVYNTRIKFINTLGVSSAWVNGADHTVIGKTAPPPEFDFFTVMVQPDGTRQYNFGYASAAAQPADWLGAEIRYTPGSVASPDWASMYQLQDATTYYTSSPVELNAPLSGVYTFACRSLDTTGNESALLVRTVNLPNRRMGSLYDEFLEGAEGWPGTRTACTLVSGVLEASDATTWATLPATWSAWTSWNMAPASSLTYEGVARDLGTVLAGQLNTTVEADGTALQELSTSVDGITWSPWGSANASFNARYIKVRVTVTPTVLYPTAVLRRLDYQVNASIKSEYINDLVISTLTGVKRIGTGDIRLPLSGTYTTIKRTTVVVQDNSAGTWTYVRIDQDLVDGPRWQFRLNGTLADPQFVDFFIEGY